MEERVIVPRTRIGPRPDRLTLCWGTPRKRYADQVDRIQRLMQSIDERLRLRDGRETYASKVSFEEARIAPVHRWYFYKEGFSPNLLATLLGELTPPTGGALLDAFHGVGTSLLSATQLGNKPFSSAIGVEYNPFAAFVAQTKLSWPRLDAWELSSLGDAVLETRITTKGLPPAPASVTLKDERIYPGTRLRDLRELAGAIDRLSKGTNRDVLRLALASVVEPASYAQKDGRALRILPKTPRRPSVRTLFGEAVEAISDDIHRVAPRRQSARQLPIALHVGDARNLPRTIADASVSMSLYSPPYLNGIDYTEVYKAEEWLLGFITSKASMFQLRQGTLRSHASVQFKKSTNELENDLDARSLVRRLMKELAAFFETEEPRRFQNQYRWLIPAYFEDMYRVLKGQWRVLMPGGYSICVVANSMFTGSLKEVREGKDPVRNELWRLPLATDAIIAELARGVGFEVPPAIGARELRPRNATNAWSRETILIFRKPMDRRP